MVDLSSAGAAFNASTMQRREYSWSLYEIDNNEDAMLCTVALSINSLTKYSFFFIRNETSFSDINCVIFFYIAAAVTNRSRKEPETLICLFHFACVARAKI